MGASRRLALVLLAVVAFAGCAVRPAEAPSQEAAVPAKVSSGRGSREPVGVNPAEYAVTYENPVPSRRLDHTIVLGRDQAIWGTPDVAAPTAPPATTVIINNSVQTAPGYGYGGYYGGYYPGTSATTGSTGSSTSGRTTPAGYNPVTNTPAPGGDWPAPTNYGPTPLR